MMSTIIMLTLVFFSCNGKYLVKFHVDIISLSTVMSNRVLLSFALKLMGIWDVGFRDCK